jgi:hypothetical protein
MLNTLIFIKSVKFVGAKNAEALKSPAAADEGIPRISLYKASL